MRFLNVNDNVEPADLFLQALLLENSCIFATVICFVVGMKRILLCVLFTLSCSIVLSSCEKDGEREGSARPLNGKYICFSCDGVKWKAAGNALGSCYAKVPQIESPQWCDVVACTEDVTDSDVERYEHYVFLHISLDSTGSATGFQMEYYKDKSTERQGDFELMMRGYDGRVYIENMDVDEISGCFLGRMQNVVNPSDVREVRFDFQDVPISEIYK